jgi:hypothetical protein
MGYIAVSSFSLVLIGTKKNNTDGGERIYCLSYPMYAFTVSAAVSVGYLEVTVAVHILPRGGGFLIPRESKLKGEERERRSEKGEGEKEHLPFISIAYFASRI